ncbi:DUF4179 domain-containing protein [Paenibacillus macquariensis]|uniref:DUF4179 domain-containing protein n=1 Tax=Paenibacillus macquariensis TaxID=948756 RepID=A0ABY1KBM1_9BACL|nr:DUF4179 domain-containing protein [Paenibacillus macquariensis]MEC0094280.1 DUF4179 domain-containing protein [Paenibacillus macquariensis]OAB32171.1 hypothetical protein PMSM_18105 [Paenibacillus macquariensis subsp. macquariensis]SIR55606.1 protein of unknown function [Paenibacillus macquariensis]
MNNRSELEDKEFNHLKKLIRETHLRVDLVEKTMKRVESSNLKDTSVDTVERTMKLVENTSMKDSLYNRSHRRNVLRRIMITLATAAAVITLVIGSTKFTSPTTTASIQQGPVMGTILKYSSDYGLKNADEKGLVTTLNRSVTHEGFTLKVPVVVYDGIRVSVGIERQTSEKKLLEDTVTENLIVWDLLINGKSTQSFAPYGKSIDSIMNPGENDNTSFLHISDLRNQGGKAFPDQFELTLTMTVSGISEPFKFNIPVNKIPEDNVDMTPSMTRKYESISMTLEKVEITPITTSITTLIKFPETMRQRSSQPDLGYAIYDDKGNELKQISGTGSYPTGRGNVISSDYGYEPFATMPKSITIKTFKYIHDKRDKSKFEFEANGEIKRFYFPALDITLPIVKK